jgi:hypothetical protein
MSKRDYDSSLGYYFEALRNTKLIADPFVARILNQIGHVYSAKNFFD